MNRVYSGKSEIPDTSGLMRLLSRMLTLMNNQMDSQALRLLINDDGTQITLSLRNYDSAEQDLQTIASAKRVEAAIQKNAHLLPEGATITSWGTIVDSMRANTIIMRDQAISTAISFLLIFLVAFVVFRSFKFGFFSIVPVLTGVMANYIFMYVAGIPFDLITVGFSSVTVGAGVDDALHFLMRYRKNTVVHRLSASEAVSMTMHQTGKPIILTTVSVISGLWLSLSPAMCQYNTSDCWYP